MNPFDIQDLFISLLSFGNCEELVFVFPRLSKTHRKWIHNNKVEIQKIVQRDLNPLLMTDDTLRQRVYAGVDPLMGCRLLLLDPIFVELNESLFFSTNNLNSWYWNYYLQRLTDSTMAHKGADCLKILQTQIKHLKHQMNQLSMLKIYRRQGNVSIVLPALCISNNLDKCEYCWIKLAQYILKLVKYDNYYPCRWDLCLLLWNAVDLSDQQLSAAIMKQVFHDVILATINAGFQGRTYLLDDIRTAKVKVMMNDYHDQTSDDIVHNVYKEAVEMNIVRFIK